MASREHSLMGKSVAVIQSSYIPWKGYFDIINTVDEFVLYDDAQYTKRDWRNRNRIKTPQGVQWLTIPVCVKGRYHQKINETTISDMGWARTHWQTIEMSYARARCFKEYAGLFADLYASIDEASLSLVNFRFIVLICSILGIDTKISWSSDFALPEGKSERLLAICKSLDATEYLSGPAARGYLDEELFRREKIDVAWMDYSGYPEYGQLYPPFDHHVSVVDLILHEGADARRFMKSFARERQGDTV